MKEFRKKLIIYGMLLIVLLILTLIFDKPDKNNVPLKTLESEKEIFDISEKEYERQMNTSYEDYASVINKVSGFLMDIIRKRKVTDEHNDVIIEGFIVQNLINMTSNKEYDYTIDHTDFERIDEKIYKFKILINQEFWIEEACDSKVIDEYLFKCTVENDKYLLELVLE